MLKIGSIPYIDHSIEATNRNCRHRPVFVVPVGSRYEVRSLGIARDSLPSPAATLPVAIERARKFIHRNKGAGLKRVSPIDTIQLNRVTARKALEEQAKRQQQRKSRRRSA